MSTQEQVRQDQDAYADEATTQALATRPTASSVVTARARGQWDPKNVELIRNTVARDCNQAELGMFLELCARYELDPFAKQIWAAKMGGRLAIIVSRDGLLAIANRQSDFLGMDGDVVREKDEFMVERRDDGPVVRHAYRGGPDARGRIVGAWAKVSRSGRGPTYFFAPFGEYKGRNVWDSNPSAMILKVAESMALRKAYSISGVVGEDEVGAPEPTSRTAAPAGPNYGEDPVVAERLETLMDALEWPPRKRLVKLAALASPEERLALVAELEDDARNRGLSVAAAPTPAAADMPSGLDPEDDVQEAHVVVDDPAFELPEEPVDGGGPLNG